MLRKNVSISNTQLKLLDPLLKKHQGNMSAAMKDIIEFVGFVNEKVGCLDSAKNLLTEKNHAKEVTNNRVYGVTIPLTLFQWLLKERNSIFPPSGDVMQLFQSHNSNIYDISTIDKTINEELSYLNWPVTVTMGHDDGTISFQISGTNPEINMFNAIMITMYCANNSKPLKMVKNLIYPASVYMQFSEAVNKEEALEIAERYFSDIEVDDTSSSHSMNNTCSSKNPLPVY